MRRHFERLERASHAYDADFGLSKTPPIRPSHSFELSRTTSYTYDAILESSDEASYAYDLRFGPKLCRHVVFREF